MRWLRVGLAVVAGMLVVAGAAVGAVLVSGASAGATAAARYDVTVVLAGEWRQSPWDVDLEVAATFEVGKRCQVSPSGADCYRYDLQAERGSVGGIHFIPGKGSARKAYWIRFRIRTADFHWNPVYRDPWVNIDAIVTDSAVSKCRKFEKLTVQASVTTSGKKNIRVTCYHGATRVREYNATRAALGMTGTALSSQWTIAGPWQLHQSNGYTVDLKLTQHRTQLSGTAITDRHTIAGLASPNGRVIGATLLGDALDFTIQWTKRDGTPSYGRYLGNLRWSNKQKKIAVIANGRAGGPQNPNLITWSAGGRASCYGPCQ